VQLAADLARGQYPDPSLTVTGGVYLQRLTAVRITRRLRLLAASAAMVSWRCLR
jgi:hypothetical protein